VRLCVVNLMCPARILLPADGLAPGVGERIAQVYAAPSAADAGERLAEQLGVRLSVVPEFVGAPSEELRAIADLHRGETVVLLGVDLGLRLPAVIEHAGDGWTVVPNDNAVTLAAYEQAAERFRESIPKEPGEELLKLFELILERAGAGASVLELGSGTGLDAIDLERRGFVVRRTDAAEAFVEMMRAEGYPADRLNALTDDFGGPYDVVFADAVFLHFDRDELGEVLRKAAQAAPLLIFTTPEGDGDEWSNRFLDLPRHFVQWREKPLRDLLTATGWAVEHLARGESRFGRQWLYVLASRA
jgi:SAM-dependent methyltransferase